VTPLVPAPQTTHCIVIQPDKHILMAKLIHTMIRVRDLDASLKFYREVFDLTPSHRLDFPEFSLVYLRNDENDSEVELTWNKGREEPYTHGDGYGHVAVAIDDVAARHAELLQAGYEPLPIKEFKVGDELLARFFFILDPDGYKIEVLEKHGHYR
jgi:lactoylglutathione lyase